MNKMKHFKLFWDITTVENFCASHQLIFDIIKYIFIILFDMYLYHEIGYFYGVWNDVHSYSIFSAPGGDFQSILDEDQVPFEQDVQRFLRQVAEALQFMHALNIAHLDIKVIIILHFNIKCICIWFVIFHT